MSDSHRPPNPRNRRYQRPRRHGRLALATVLAASVSPLAQLIADPPVNAPPLPPLPPAVEPTLDPTQAGDWSSYGAAATVCPAPTTTPTTTETIVVEPSRARFRPLIRRTPASLPTPITPDPLTGVLQVELVSRLEPGCDPVLYGFWLSELRAAVNASPRFRVIDVPPGPGFADLVRDGAAGADPAAALRTGYGPGLPAFNTESEPADLRLCVCARSITPFRPMRIDADLLLLDPLTGAPVARLDGVWQAPTEGLPLKPTRKGWFRRDWHAPPAFTEAAALEANSPRMFLRGTAQRMAETLTHEVNTALPAGQIVPPTAALSPPGPGMPGGMGTLPGAGAADSYGMGFPSGQGSPAARGMLPGPGLPPGASSTYGTNLPPGSGFPAPPGLPRD